jgi:type VI protein secretion system component Hcp
MTKPNVKKPSPEPMPELSEAQLSMVSGGKAAPALFTHCVTGAHIKKATITC